MISLNLSRLWTNRLSWWMLTVGTLAALGVTIQIGRPRLIGASYFLIGTAVTFGVTRYVAESDTGTIRRFETHSLKIGAIVALLCVSTVLLVGPGVVFYSFVGSVFVLGLVHTTHSPTVRATGLVAIASFLLMYSQVVPFEFTALTRDTVAHTLKISFLMERGEVSGDFMPRYARTPIYHVLVSEYGIVSGLEARLAAFAVTGVAFVLSMFPLYVIDRRLPLVRHERHLLVSLVLFSSVFIYHGYRVFPQSLTFVYMILILAVLTSRGYQYLLCFVLFTVCTILTNTLGAILSSILLVMFLATRGEWTGNELLKTTIFGVSLSYYWVLTSIFDLAVFYFMRGSGAAKGVESTIYIIKNKSQLIEAMLSGVKFGLNLADLSVLAGLFASGAIYMLYSDRRRYLAFVGFSAVFLFPNPAWFVLRGLALTGRWPLMVIPFALIPVAIALHKNRIATSYVGVVLLFVLAFTSGSLAMSEPSLTDMAGYTKEKQHSITESEISVISFVESHSRSQVNARWILYTFINYNDRVEQRSYRAELLSIERLGGSLSRQEGLTVVPHKALEESAVRLGVEKPSEQRDIQFTELVTNDDADFDVRTRNKVYENGANDILHRQITE